MALGTVVPYIHLLLAMEGMVRMRLLHLPCLQELSTISTSVAKVALQDQLDSMEVAQLEIHMAQLVAAQQTYARLWVTTTVALSLLEEVVGVILFAVGVTVDTEVLLVKVVWWVVEPLVDQVELRVPVVLPALMAVALHRVVPWE